jgi:hypothetical protein
VLNYIIENPESILNTATLAVAIASFITMKTETPPPETFLGKAYRIIEMVAMVVGKAKQK